MSKLTWDGTATAAEAETRTDNPPLAAPGLVVRPIFGTGPGQIVTVVEEPATNSNVTAVPVSAVPVVLLAANPARLGFSIRNTSTVDILYVLASPAGVVSPLLHTVALRPSAYYEDPYHYVGQVTGVWSAATDGEALMTEYLP